MPRPFRALIPAAAMILLLLFLGCSEKLAKQKGLTDADLLARGQKKADQKKFEDAAEAFQLLTERFPNSPLAPRAQFSLASCRASMSEYLEAEVAFDDFLRLYPADPKVPDALYMKGDLLYKQIQAVGRSQDKTLEAIDAYKRFLEKEPDSPRSAEARARIKEMRKRLVQHEEGVISHYLSRKLYESAEARTKRVLEEYPDASPTPTLLLLLAEAMEKQGKKEEASLVRKTQAEQFPDTGETKPSAVSSLAGGGAGPRSSPRSRRGNYEVTLQPRYVASKDIGFEGGTKIELDPALGFGLGFGYNFTNNFALHLDASWTRADYLAKIATYNDSGSGTATADGTLEFGTIALNMTYYILDGPLTPFVMGGIGWTWVDSNIPSGPPESYCWYDPWYGDVCESYQNTYTKSYFSYNLGLGVRWDLAPAYFLRGSMGWQWVDLGRAGTTDFMGGRIDLGYMF